MSADDEADEEYGNCVKKMRIGSNTNTNYRSRLKKIIEYFSSPITAQGLWGRTRACACVQEELGGGGLGGEAALHEQGLD